MPITINNRAPVTYDGGQVGAYEQQTQQLFNLSSSSYGLPPNPQLVNESLATGMSSNLAQVYQQGQPQYQSMLTSSPIGQPPIGPNYNQMATALVGSTTPNTTLNFDKQSYLKNTKGSLGNDQTLIQLGENPPPNIGYLRDLQREPDKNRISRYQNFLVAHGYLDPKNQQLASGTWDQATELGMEQYLAARYAPQAIYGQGNDRIVAAQFMDALGMNVNDLITANSHGTSTDFQKQIFENWLRTQDPNAQRDALNNYMSTYGRSSVPQDIASMAGGGFFDDLGGAISGLLHGSMIPAAAGGVIGGILGSMALPIVGSAIGAAVGGAIGAAFGGPVGDVVGKISDPFVNLLTFQIPHMDLLHHPGDIFNDTRGLQAADLVRHLQPQDAAALQGVVDQTKHSMGFLGFLDGYERFRVQAIYGGIYNFGQLFEGGNHHFENPFDPTTTVGQAALKANGDLLGGDDPVSKAIRDAPVLGSIASFVVNTYSDPLSYVPVGKGLKVGGKGIMLADRALPIGSVRVPMKFGARGFEMTVPAFVKPGQPTWVGRSIQPFMTSPMQRLLGDKISNFLDRQGVMDILKAKSQVQESGIAADEEFSRATAEYNAKRAAEDAQNAAELEKVQNLTPESPEVAASRARYLYERKLDRPPTLGESNWTIHSAPGAYDMLAHEQLSEAEQTEHASTMANAYKDIPKPTSVPDDLVVRRRQFVDSEEIQGPYEALMNKFYQSARVLPDGSIRYTNFRSRENLKEGLDLLEEQIPDLQRQVDEANKDPNIGAAERARLQGQLDIHRARADSYRQAIRTYTKQTGRGVQAGVSRPIRPKSLGEPISYGDATLKKFRDMAFGASVHEHVNEPLFNEERALLTDLLRKYQKMQGTRDASLSMEPGAILKELQDEWQASYDRLSGFVKANIIAKRAVPGPTVHPADMDPAGYVAAAQEQFGANVVSIDDVRKSRTEFHGKPEEKMPETLASAYADTSGVSELGPISERIEPSKKLPPRAKVINAVDVSGTYWKNPFDNLEEYAQWVKQDPDRMRRVRELRGRVLAVEDPAKPNVGPILLKLAEDSYNRVTGDQPRTYAIIGEGRPDYLAMVSHLHQILRHGDTVVHDGSEAGQMAADILGLELKHLGITPKHEPRQEIPQDLSKPVSGNEQIQRPQYDSQGKPTGQTQRIRQYKYLRKDIILSGADPKLPQIEQIRNALRNESLKKELMSTAGRPLKISDDQLFNKNLEAARAELFGGKANELRRANFDKTATGRQHRQILDVHKPDQVIAFHPEGEPGYVVNNMIENAKPKGVPVRRVDKMADHAQVIKDQIATKRAQLEADHRWRAARAAEAHDTAYIQQRRLEFWKSIEQQGDRPPPPERPKAPDNIAHQAEVDDIARMAELSRRSSDWARRLQAVAHVIAHPEVGPHEISMLLNVPENPEGLAHITALAKMKNPEDVMRYLADEKNFLSHAAFTPRGFHIFEERMKGLQAVRDARMSDTKLLRFLRLGGIDMTNTDLSFMEKPLEASRKIDSMLTSVGVPRADIKRFLNNYILADDPVARRAMLNEQLFTRVAEHFDSDPKLRALGGWKAFSEWKWASRTGGEDITAKTVAYAPKEGEGGRITEQSRGPVSTGDPMRDEEVRNKELALVAHDKMVEAWVATKAAKAMHGSEKQTVADFEAAKNYVMNMADSSGRTTLERFDSQRQLIQTELDELTKGMPQDRAVPAIPAHLQFKGSLPFTPYEAVVWQYPKLRKLESVQDHVRADWLSSQWKKVVLTRGATSFRIALGDEVSRFVMSMLSEGHYLAAASYTADQLKGLAKKPARAAYRLLPGDHTPPKWTDPTIPDERILWSMEGAFHLLDDHSIHVYTPNVKDYEKAVQRMFGVTLKNDAVAPGWSKIFHRDYDIDQLLHNAEREHAMDNIEGAHNFLVQAHDLIKSREDLSGSRDSMNQTILDYLNDQENMKQEGTLYEQVAKSPDFSHVTKQLRDEPGNADILDLLEENKAKSENPLEDAKKLMEERGLTVESALLDQILTSTQLKMKKPRLDLTDVRAGLVRAHEQAAIKYLTDFIMTPMVREGQVMHLPDGTERTATKEDERRSKQAREMRRLNHIDLEGSGWADEIGNAYAQSNAQWNRDKFHSLSMILEKMSRQNAPPSAYMKLERIAQEDLGISIRTRTDETGKPLGATKRAKKGDRRIWRVKGGDPTKIYTNIDAAREAAGATMDAKLEYADLPAPLVQNYDNQAWKVDLPGEADRNRMDHTIHNQAARSWAAFHDTGEVTYASYKAQAYAAARKFRDKANELETGPGKKRFSRQLGEEWAQHTHGILDYWTKHPLLKDALYNGKEPDMKALAKVLSEDRYAETHLLPTIAQPGVGSMSRKPMTKANEMFNWYHENITQAMVNYARQTGLLKMQKLYSKEIGQFYGLDEADPKVQELAGVQAMNWVRENTYQGQRTVLAHSVRNIFPFWGATANMSRFWASLLADPIKVGGVNTHVYGLMPALNFMSRVDQSNTQGGVKIPIQLSMFMSAMGMGAADEIMINPAHMFFFTQDGISSFVPSVGPVMSYGLDLAASADPGLVEELKQMPVVGDAYTQYINSNGFNPILGWGSQLASGAFEAVTGRAPQDTLFGKIPGLLGSQQAEDSRILNETRAEAAQAAQDAHDAGQPSYTQPDTGDVTRHVGLQNLLDSVLGFALPLAPSATSHRSQQVKDALADWDVAPDGKSKDAVIAKHPDVAPLLKYFDNRTTASEKDAIALQEPWIVPYATSKYAHPEGPQFTPSLQDFTSKLNAGDIQLVDPQAYLAKVNKNIEFTTASTAYSLLKGQEDQFLQQTGVASTSALAKQWRATYYYPQLIGLARQYPEWAQTFVNRPGYDALSKFEESRPLRSLLSWEAIPQADNLNSSTTALWTQILADVQQTASGLQDISHNGGTSVDQQNLMYALDVRLQGYANQDPAVAELLRHYHFGRVEDLLQSAAY